MWRKLTQLFARWQAHADRNARRLAELDAYDRANPSPPSKFVSEMRETANTVTTILGAITAFFGVALTVALAVGLIPLALWDLFRLLSFSGSTHENLNRNHIACSNYDHTATRRDPRWMGVTTTVCYTAFYGDSKLPDRIPICGS